MTGSESCPPLKKYEKGKILRHPVDCADLPCPAQYLIIIHEECQIY